MRRTLICLALGAVLAACATTPEPISPTGLRVYVVRRGDTLWSISQRHGTTVAAVSRVNRLRDPSQIAVGQRLLIPPRSRLNGSRTDNWSRSDPRGRAEVPSLVWPVRGRVTSGFGLRSGAHHDGLDIPARKGAPVLAAEAGRVVHSDDSLAGYGNMIILKHAGRLSTVYAHNRRNLVEVGEFVEKGQIIAEVGSSGRTTASHLHFEVRRDGKPVDPLDYLP